MTNQRFMGMVAALLLAGGVTAAWAAEVEVPMVYDLPPVAEQARQAQLPILLVFSASDCDYCKLLEEEFLKPMLISKQYTDKVIIRRVMIDSSLGMKDFDGHKIETEDLARMHKVRVTPTLVFVDNEGKALGPRLVGINTLDFYGAYLDRAIDESRDKVRAHAL